MVNRAIFSSWRGVTTKYHGRSFWETSRWVPVADKIVEEHGLHDLSALEYFFLEHTGDVLGAGDRQELLQHYLAGRANRQRNFLIGLGLRCHAAEEDYDPGRWTLSPDSGGGGAGIVIQGITATHGHVTSVRLTIREFASARLAWRAIAREVGSEGHPNPPASQWRRIWWGCEDLNLHGQRQKALGINAALMVELRQREEGKSHESN